MRSALIWLGEPDPLLSRASVEDSDPVRNKLRAVLLAWHTTFRTVEATSHQAALRASETLWDKDGSEYRPAQALFDVLEEYFSDAKGINTTLLGKFLKKHTLRIESGARFEAVGMYGARQLWKVVICNQADFEKALQKFSGSRTQPSQPSQPSQPNQSSPFEGLKVVKDTSDRSEKDAGKFRI